MFDYVIIGAGSAGYVLANRLTEDPNCRVLLVEAGGEDDSPLIRTPAFYGQLQDSPFDCFDLTKRHGKEPAATASVVPKAYQARIHVLNLENCGRRSDDMSGLEIMKAHPLPDNVCFWAGVIDVMSTITETAEQVADRIRRLLQVVPAQRLGVTTDCGLILLQRYIAIDKLHALVQGTELVRAERAKKAA